MKAALSILAAVIGGHAVLTAAPEAKVTDVFVVIKSHFDLGFTDQAANVFQRYRGEMMDKALLNMARISP